ncbi:MAG: CPBP family intramembrane glutamic endopeptidase [Eudoraea sp.]|uniref:CPBP family intramembrane glutamic endopeptidase n=1 Tax=Eudoraea sp. TaxID=1979955 RepID=UPI003C74A261
MPTIKNQSPFVIAIVILGIMAIIMLTPTEAVFNKVINNDFKLEYVDLIFKMGLLFFMGYGFIRILKTHMLGGLTRQFPWRFKYLNLIPVYLFIIGLLSIYWSDFSQIVPTNVLLLLFACLMVGFAEEYIFRGLLQPLFLRKYGSRKYGVFLSILLASVFFGIFHLLNLAKNDSIWQVLVQVVFAFFIGFFFGVLLLKTNKLIPISITHGLINFFFSLAFLPGIKTLQNEAAETVSFAPIILFLPLFIIGLLIYKKLNKKEIIYKLEIENIHD